MSALPLAPGERAYLVARTRTAPSAAYRTPEVTVIRTAYPYLTVRLPDGAEVTTHTLNVTRTRPSGRSR